MTILVGDIGGTSSRFALADPGADPARVHDVAVQSNARHRSLSDAIRDYLAETGARPGCAVIAMAGPVTGEVLHLTNLDWSFSPRQLAAEFGFDTVVINDFEAVAWALPYLPASALAPIGGARPREDRAKAVLGPGTGLGVAGLAHWHGRWVAVPSEGGHVEFAAVTAEEFAVFERIRSRLGRVSAEFVLSGPGLERLHRARGEVRGFPVEEGTRAADVTAGAFSGETEELDTVRLFLRLLARFAGDVAVMFAAEGGVYLHGGVAQKLAPLIDPTAFRAEFEHKAPHEALLARVATLMITEPAPALAGCAAVAAERSRAGFRSGTESAK